MPQLKEQIALPLDYFNTQPVSRSSYRERLVALLNENLNFHSDYSLYAAHNFHSFPAKFPPQLPQKFIQYLTRPGEVVLDPMAGSGTTILEAYLANRQAIGFDIDPLALMISETKVTPINKEKIDQWAGRVLCEAREKLHHNRERIEQVRLQRWDQESLEFINYWFSYSNQLELLALIMEIEQIPEYNIQLFLKLALSAIIITKSGGVSLALDLAHTRPHRAKIVYDQNGQEILRDTSGNPSKHLDILTKTLRSPFVEFEKRYKNNLRGVSPSSTQMFRPRINFGDAQALPLKSSIMDLIVTSPPYASNAIDYMRAHKFSLVWLGYSLGSLSQKRQEYIGGETLNGVFLESLSEKADQIVHRIASLDKKKGLALHRYYSEMTRVLREMYRVLKPGKAAIVVVGSSIIRGVETETQDCLASIGREIGFDIPAIGVRKLDRNRRMLPASTNIDISSQIQQRMHEEYVIGFIKPEK
jgi:DNA modification methylase